MKKTGVYRFYIYCGWLCLILFSSCKQNTSPDLPEQKQENRVKTPRDIAQLLCKYHRGAFMNWPLYADYRDYLTPDEADAVQFIANRLDEEVAPSFRPKNMAVARFLADNTQCTLVGEQPVTGKNIDLIRFIFDQDTPIIPNVPDVDMRHRMPADEIIQKYMQAFAQNYDGKVFTRKVGIELFKTEDQNFLMRSDFNRNYAIPLENQSFWDNLDHDRFDKAGQVLNLICKKRDARCEDLSKHYYADFQFSEAMKEQFYTNVSVSEIKYKVVVLSYGKSYTSASFRLENRGYQKYQKIVFKTNESSPQYCILQASQNNRGDDPLVLAPGQTVNAWCALKDDTLPTVDLTFVSSF